MSYSDQETELEELTPAQIVNNNNQFQDIQNIYTTKYIRNALKMIRVENKTAYDSLPSGETVGAFSNRYALDKYTKKLIRKRDRMRITRRNKKINEIIFPQQ